MDYIEFHATIKDGAVEIPLEYRGRITGEVRVLVFPLEPTNAHSNLIQELLAHPVRAPGFRPLTRDEIYGE